MSESELLLDQSNIISSTILYYIIKQAMSRCGASDDYFELFVNFERNNPGFGFRLFKEIISQEKKNIELEKFIMRMINTVATDDDYQNQTGLFKGLIMNHFKPNTNMDKINRIGFKLIYHVSQISLSLDNLKTMPITIRDIASTLKKLMLIIIEMSQDQNVNGNKLKMFERARKTFWTHSKAFSDLIKESAISQNFLPLVHIGIVFIMQVNVLLYRYNRLYLD